MGTGLCRLEGTDSARRVQVKDIRSIFGARNFNWFSDNAFRGVLEFCKNEELFNSSLNAVSVFFTQG